MKEGNFGEEVLPSSPGSLEFSNPSTPASYRTSSLDSTIADIPIAISTYPLKDKIISLPEETNEETKTPQAVTVPIVYYTCGHIDFRSGIMCEQRFSANEDRTCHLRYEHGKIEDKYLVPRAPKVAMQVLEKGKKKIKPTAKTKNRTKKPHQGEAKRQPSLEL